MDQNCLLVSGWRLTHDTVYFGRYVEKFLWACCLHLQPSTLVPIFWTANHIHCDDCTLDTKQSDCNLWDMSQCGVLQNWRSCMNSTVAGWMMWTSTGNWMLETLLLYALLAACSRGLSVILLQVFHSLRASKGHWDRWKLTGTGRNLLWWPGLWV